MLVELKRYIAEWQMSHSIRKIKKIINIYAPHDKAPKYTKQRRAEMEKDNATISTFQK